MSRFVTLCAGASLAIALAATSPASAETFKLTSLEWPPYAGPALPDQGLSVRLARSAFAAMGHTLEVEFYPWKRTVQTGLGAGYAGYFPEYYSDELAATDCAFSNAAGSGPLGFVESTTAPVTWTTLADLKGKRIGTVAGYVSSAALTEQATAGTLTLEPVTDDLTNVRKVAAGRIDLAEIDVNVLAWLVERNPDLKNAVRMNGHLLEDKPLHVCFQKTEAGDRARAVFNEGLKKIDIPSLMSSQ